jgi:DNA-binding PadR family transcriptional regulator
LRRLEENGLVEPIDTQYSVKGREMNVYALTAEKLVVQFGAAEQSQ